MENIEQLKQDNAKLQERLNNAAKFFREQKTQIESLTNEVKEKTSLAMDYRNQIEDLTKENEELKRTPKEEVIDTEKWNALATEKENLNKQCNEYELKLQKLENDIESKDLYIKELQNTYNEVFAEKEKISKQFKEQEKFESEVINTKVPELETKLHNAEDAYEALRKKYSEIKELHDGDLNRYNELEDNYEGLQNKYNEEKELLGQTSKKCEELRESNKMLQDNSVKLNNDIQTYQKKYDETKVLVEGYKEEIGDLNATIKKQQEEYELLNQQLTDAKGDREAFRSQLVEAEKNLDRINKIYDTLESEKLTLQADNETLQEKIKYIEANNINDKEWQDHLENVIEQIRNLADDVINPKPVSNENKENVMKRTGDYNVSGENIGV